MNVQFNCFKKYAFKDTYIVPCVDERNKACFRESVLEDSFFIKVRMLVANCKKFNINVTYIIKDYLKQCNRNQTQKENVH